MNETLLIKLAVTLFVLAGVMCVIAGSTRCYLFTKRFNSTIRIILYSGCIIISLVTILANLSSSRIAVNKITGAQILIN